MRKLLFAAICVMALAACQTQKELYSWYDSEDATYQYTKRLTDEKLEKAMVQYQKVIAKQKGTRKSLLILSQKPLFQESLNS